MLFIQTEEIEQNYSWSSCLSVMAYEELIPSFSFGLIIEVLSVYYCIEIYIGTVLCLLNACVILEWKHTAATLFPFIYKSYLYSHRRQVLQLFLAVTTRLLSNLAPSSESIRKLLSQRHIQ